MDYSRAEHEGTPDKVGRALNFDLRASEPESVLLRVAVDTPQDVAIYVNLRSMTVAEDVQINWRVYAGSAPGCRPGDEPCAEWTTYLDASEQRAGLLLALRGFIATTYLLSVEITGGGRISGTVSFLLRPSTGTAEIEAGPVIG